MIKNVYRLSEYSALLEVSLTREEAQQLAARFTGKLDITPSITLSGRYNLQAYQYVGQIALANTTIIIEPKTPVTNLAHMLSVVYDLIQWQRADRIYTTIDDWCELTIRAFLDALLELLHGGLKQEYLDVSENLVMVRGQIDFTNQINENFGQVMRHRCIYDDLSADGLENRLLKLALDRVAALRLSDSLLWRLARAESGLAKVSLPVQADFEKLTFTRLNEHYRRPLALARMVIELTTPITPTGEIPQQLERGQWPAFLVDMNRLFERYLAVQLARSFQSSSLQSEPSDKILESENFSFRYQQQVYLDQQSQLAMRPDFLIIRGKTVVAVLDAKYKLNREAADYYQMVAYCVALSVSRAWLLYPAWQEAQTRMEINNSAIAIETVPIQLQGSISELDDSIDALVARVRG